MTDRELMQMALPCPFCGSNKVSVEEGSTFRWVYATCNDCGAQAGEVRKQTVGEGNPQQWHEKAQRRAMEEWNTRARLAQPEPEPNIEEMAEAVHNAYLTTCDALGWDVRPENRVPYAELTEDSKELDRASVRAVLRFTAPPQREWQGLTDREIDELFLDHMEELFHGRDYDYERAIEAKLKEKNHG